LNELIRLDLRELALKNLGSNEWHEASFFIQCFHLDVVFEIAKKGDKTEVHFTHVGLVPANECYGVCSDAWGSYITGSLRDLITTGKGQPNPIEEIVTKARQMSREAESE
jgi:hypothetical protein